MATFIDNRWAPVFSNTHTHRNTSGKWNDPRKLVTEQDVRTKDKSFFSSGGFVLTDFMHLVSGKQRAWSNDTAEGIRKQKAGKNRFPKQFIKHPWSLQFLGIINPRNYGSNAAKKIHDVLCNISYDIQNIFCWKEREKHSNAFALACKRKFHFSLGISKKK